MQKNQPDQNRRGIGRLALRRIPKSKVDEVAVAKAALLQLKRPEQNSFAIVRKRPILSIGVAFAAGVLIGKNSTVGAVARIGGAFGLRTAISKSLREFF